MSNEELQRRLDKGRGRRLWDNHGSWLLLAFVAIMCYMVGAQHTAYGYREAIKELAASYERQDALRVARIRQQNEQILQLTGELAPAAKKAADQAAQAAEKASRVLDTLSPGDAGTSTPSNGTAPADAP